MHVSWILSLLRPYRAVCLLALLCSGSLPAQAQQGSALPPRTDLAALAACRRNLLAIGRALAAYQRDRGKLPDWLSQLYPKYLKDKRLLICPVDVRRGVGDPGHPLADPYLPVSYLWEFCPAPGGPGGTLGAPCPPHPTWQQMKQAQRVNFGDHVVAVTCGHHAPPPGLSWSDVNLRLSLNGRVFAERAPWEWGPDAMPFIAERLAADLAAGQEVTRRNWNLGAVESIQAFYFHDVDGPQRYRIQRRFASVAHPGMAQDAIRIYERSRSWNTGDRQSLVRLARWFWVESGAAPERGRLPGFVAAEPEGIAVMRSQSLTRSGSFEQAAAVLERQLLRPGNHFPTVVEMARVQHASGRLPEALGFLRTRLGPETRAKCFTRERAQEVVAALNSLIDLLDAARNQGSANEVDALYPLALAVIEQTRPAAPRPGRQAEFWVRPTTEVAVWIRLAGIASAQGYYSEASRLMVDAGRLAGYFRGTGPWADAMHSLGMMYLDMGDLVAARRCLEAAGHYFRQHGIVHLQNPTFQSFVALERGDYATARKLLEYAYRLDPGPWSWYSVQTPRRLGDLALRQGDFAAAERWYGKVVAGPRVVPIAADASHLGLAEIASERGDFAGARKHCESVIQQPAEEGQDPFIAPVSGHQYYVALAHWRLGKLDEEQGRLKDALVEEETALRMLRSQSPRQENLPGLLRDLERCALEDGDTARALDYRTQAQDIVTLSTSSSRFAVGARPSVPTSTLGPEIRFLAPTADSAIPGDEAVAQVAFLSPVPLRRYRVWINGRPFGDARGFDLPQPDGKGRILDKGRVLDKGRILDKGEDHDQLAREVPEEFAPLVRDRRYAHYLQLRLTFPVDDTDGEFLRIAIQAETQGGTFSSRQLLNLRRPQAETNRGSLRVLAIGVGDYDHLPKLGFAAQDALDLGAAFQAQGGDGMLYRGAYIRILTNGDATLAAIRQAIDQFVANTRPGDTLILALSGHGVKRGQSTYFAPIRFDPANCAGTGLDWKEVLDRLQEARKTARAIWVLADCCRSAPGLRRDAVVARDFQRGVEDGGNLIVCTASSGDAPSYESADLKHGIFTQAWLDALRGKAPEMLYETTARGRVLTLSCLQSALDLSIRRYARVAGVRQQMEFPRLEGSFSSGQPLFVPVAER